MKHTKQLLFALAVLLCLLALTLSVFADDHVRVEEYDGFTYTYDAETHTLTVSGEGCVTQYKKYNMATVKHLIFSEGITEIRRFCGTAVQDVVLPSTLTALGDQALSDCRSLKSITLPESVVRLDTAALRGCSALESVVIPASVTEIPKECFTNCTRLREVRLPEGISVVGEAAFDRCTALQTIELPETLKRIERNAFSESGLTAVALRHVERLGKGAFRGCGALASIDWGDSLRVIGELAFDGCSLLSDIALPASVESLEYGTFRDCSGLRTIALPAGLTKIPSSSFLGAGLTQVVIPDGVTEIEAIAFRDCASLERAVIPESVVTIAPDAFLQYAGFEERSADAIPFFSQTLTIVGKSGSAADAYAAEHGLRFEDADTGAIRESSCGTAEVSDVTLEAYRRWAKIYGYTLRDPSGAVYDPKAERAQWLHVALLCGVSVLLIGIGSLGMLRRRKRK